MKFKNPFNAEEKRRRRIAQQALEAVRRLSAARYPVALLLDKLTVPVQREAGDSWPDAYARFLGMDLMQLRDFLRGTIDTGFYQSNEASVPTTKDLLSYFSGWAMVLIETERQLEGPK